MVCYGTFWSGQFHNDIKIQAEQHRVGDTINPYHCCLTSKVKGRSLKFLMHSICRKRMCVLGSESEEVNTTAARRATYVLAGHFSLVSPVTGNILILYSNPILATGANLLVCYNSCVRLFRGTQRQFSENSCSEDDVRIP